MIPWDTLQEVGATLERHRWIFAKTMPDNPHWYTLRKKWARDDEFVACAQAIRAYGYEEKYEGKRYAMLNVNQYKYWTMGAPLDSTLLINRKLLVQDAAYDAIAPQYDSLFQDAQSLKENAAVCEKIGNLSTLSVLDIGCGTGLLLDYQKPYGYLGVDVSVEMLRRLATKYPSYADETLHCRFEDLVTDERFDVAVCLFGAANYLPVEAVQRIPRFVKPGGRYHVMFAKEGYTPETYKRSGVTPAVPFHAGVHASLPGTLTEIGNFYLLTGYVSCKSIT